MIKLLSMWLFFEFYISVASLEEIPEEIPEVSNNLFSFMPDDRSGTFSVITMWWAESNDRKQWSNTQAQSERLGFKTQPHPYLLDGPGQLLTLSVPKLPHFYLFTFTF